MVLPEVPAVTQSAEAQAAIEFVLAYQAARSAWELEAWRTRGAGSAAKRRERFLEAVYPFIAASGSLEMSYGDPPMTDPGRTEIVSAKRRGPTYVVTTREQIHPQQDIWYEHRYVVVRTDGVLGISDIRMLFENGRWMSVLK
jgi:hypothetical protein